MRFLITLFLLANVASAAEVPLADAPVGPSTSVRMKIAAASNGHGFLVVSREMRERFGIFGMRADDRGQPIDPVMFLISDDATDEPLGVASDGDSYLVAWSTYAAARTLHLARVDDQGHVTPGGELANVVLVSMAWGGSAYVIAYIDLADDSLDAAVVASDGTILRARQPILTGNFNRSSFRLASGASGTVIATWTANDNAVHATFLRTTALSDGSYVAPASNETTASYTQVSPAAVASNGSQSLVVWAETITPVQPVSTSTMIRARRLDVNGLPAGSVFDVANLGADAIFGLAAAWNGKSFVVSYSRYFDAGGSLVSIASNDHVTTLHEFSNPEGWFPLVALAGNGHGALYAWSDGRLHGALADATLGTPQTFSRTTAVQSQPGIAWCGDAYRAVWTENTDNWRVLFGRVGVNGLPLDGEGIRIRESSRPQLTPKIACSATNALVAWREYDFATNASTLRAALVDRDGTSLAPIELGPPFSGGPAVVWNGSEYLAAWEASQQQIALLRVSRDGQPIDATPQLLTAGGLSMRDPGVSIAWNGSEYLLAWSGSVLRLTASLTPIGPARAVSSTDAWAPIAIAGNGEWLVAWSEAAGGKFARLSSSLDEVEHGSIDGRPSDGAFTGNGYRVVTNDSAISHGASVAAVIHKQVTGELLTRLYISIDSGRVRASRR